MRKVTQPAYGDIVQLLRPCSSNDGPFYHHAKPMSREVLAGVPLHGSGINLFPCSCYSFCVFLLPPIATLSSPVPDPGDDIRL